jgi:hypothetical protein
MDSPDQNACSNRSIARRVREYRKILSIAIAQTQIEQEIRPSMMIRTTQPALPNRSIRDRPVLSPVIRSILSTNIPGHPGSMQSPSDGERRRGGKRLREKTLT